MEETTVTLEREQCEALLKKVVFGSSHKDASLKELLESTIPSEDEEYEF